MQQIISPTLGSSKSAGNMRREARAIIGWPLPALAQLDRKGARGLVADLTHAGALTRQAAFVAVACADLDNPAVFLSRLGVERDGAEGIGIALRRRHARDVIAATFGVASADVPTGYLRSLIRIEEAGTKAAGYDPFSRPETYRTLFEVLSSNPMGRRANALRYAGKMRSSTVDAVITLDPILLWPEVLNATSTPGEVAAANAMLSLIRACISTSTDDGLVSAMRQSLRRSGTLSAFASKALERADRLPTPLPAAEGIRPLRTAQDYRDLGTRLRNCAATKVPEVALGLLAVYEATHRDADGTEVVVAVSLTPTTDGRWMVSEIGGAKNRWPPTPVLRDVLLRFQSLGAIIPGPGADGHYRADLARMLGVYRYKALDDALHPHGDDEDDDALAALEDGEAA